MELMRKIQMVDTKNQYLAIKKEVDESIQVVLDSASYINGKAVQDFSQSLASYLQVSHVIPCANGTDALQIAMMALGLKTRGRSNHSFIHLYCDHRGSSLTWINSSFCGCGSCNLLYGYYFFKKCNYTKNESNSSGSLIWACCTHGRDFTNC